MKLNKNIVLRVIFFGVCFVLADVTKIRVMDVCGSSPCRGDRPGAPFYVEGASNLLLAPTVVLSPMIQQVTWPVRTERTSLLNISRGSWGHILKSLQEHPFLVTLLPTYSILVDFPPKHVFVGGPTMVATAKTAVMSYMWQKFLILLSIPWWEFLYRRIRSLWTSRKGVAVFLVLVLGAFLTFGTLFMRADFGGEAIVTWRLIPEVLSGGDGSKLLSRFPAAG